MFNFFKWFTGGIVVALLISMACDSKASPIFSQYGDWSVALMDVGVAAHTVDENGQVLSVFCQLNGMCVQGISVAHSCEAGKTTLLTLNADGDTFPWNGECFHAPIRGIIQNYYAFENFNEIEKIIRESNNLKVTIPLEDGSLDNYSFSLKGSNDAYEKVSEIMMLSQRIGDGQSGNGSGIQNPLSPTQDQGGNEFDI